MGRKANPNPEVMGDDFDAAEAGNKATSLATLAQRSLEIAQRFGDGLPYDRNRCIGLARNSLSLGSFAMLEAGKQLIQIKENEPHGEFVEIVEEQLGLNPRTAQKMMQAAAKFLSPALAAKASPAALLGPSKLFELMTEDEEDLVELANGGTLAGKTLDQMQTMTRSELRAALADARKSLAAKDKVIQAKSSKVDKLEEELAGRDAAPLEEVEEQQLNDLRTATLDAEASLQRLLVLVDDVIGMPATDATSVAARHSLDYLVQRVVDGCLARGITVDLADRVSPIWAKPLEDAAAANAAGRKPRGKK